MSSRTSFFNPTIAKKGIKRTFPLWLTHFIIWVLAMPILLSNIGSYSTQQNFNYYVLMTVHVGGVMMAFVFSAAMTEVLSNYLYSTRSIGFYHAIPVKRDSLFITNLVVTVGALIVPAALVGLMALFVEKSFGFSGGAYILKWLWMYVQLCVFFTGFSLLCAHITGHAIAGPIIYAILNFAAVIIEFVIRYIMSIFIYGFSVNGDLRASILSPLYHIYYKFRVVSPQNAAVYYTGDKYYLWLLIAGIIMTIGAFAFYRCRRSESAGEIVSSRPMRPLFKYGMTAGFALVVGMIFYVMSYEVRNGNSPSIIWFTFCMLLGGAVGYFGSEMMLKKSFRIFKRSLKGFLAIALVIVLFGTSIALDVSGIESYVPSEKEISSVELYTNGTEFTAEIKAGDDILPLVLELHNMIIANKETSKQLSNENMLTPYNWTDNNGYYFSYITINYTLNNGRKISRQYSSLPIGKQSSSGEVQDAYGYIALINKIYSSPDIIQREYSALWPDNSEYRINEYLIHSNDYSQSYFLKSSVYPSLLWALQNDLLSGSITMFNPSSNYSGKESPENTYHIEINCSNPLSNETEKDYRYYSFTITEKAARVFAILSDPSNYQDNPNNPGTVQVKPA
ncbi:MAG: hypothetical protein VB078_08640 [Clostridiaceae bacterium]|nr:hypothetical protein [Clostridiaceae bacterium]